MKTFASARELCNYLEEPPQMPSGSPGKVGVIHMTFERKGEKSIMRKLSRSAPLIVQQELYWDECMPEMPCVYIMSSSGAVLQGDRNEIIINMEANSFAHVAGQSATKVNEMSYNYASQYQEFTLQKGSYLEYLPEQVIPHKHARYIGETSFKVDPTATLVCSEILMSGRKYYGEGEQYQYDLISLYTHGENLEGHPLFREKFLITPQDNLYKNVGVMGKYDVMANVFLLTPSEHAEAIYNQMTPKRYDDLQVITGLTRLPHKAGLCYKILGMEAAPVKKLVREFFSVVRSEVKGHPLPPDFPWR